MSRVFTSLAATIVLLTLTSATMAGEAWDAGLAIRQANQQVHAERVAQMLYLTPFLPEAAIQDQIDAVILDPQLGEPAREMILRDYAYQLRDWPPDPVALASLQILAGYTSKVLVSRPESRGARLVPLFDVAIAARGTINQWLRESTRARTAAELEQGRFDFLHDLQRSAYPQQIAGAADAVRIAHYYSVQLLLDPLQAVLVQSPELTPIALAAAFRIRDQRLLRQIIDHGEGINSAIRQILDYVTAEQAGLILFDLASGERTDLAALAITTLGQQIHSIEDAGEFLLGLLGDRELGAAAGLALARNADPRMLIKLAAMLKNTTNLPRQRHAALALKLNGSDGALEILQDFARYPANSRLSGEVQQWLH